MCALNKHTHTHTHTHFFSHIHVHTAHTHTHTQTHTCGAACRQPTSERCSLRRRGCSHPLPTPNTCSEIVRSASSAGWIDECPQLHKISPSWVKRGSKIRSGWKLPNLSHEGTVRLKLWGRRVSGTQWIYPHEVDARNTHMHTHTHTHTHTPGELLQVSCPGCLEQPAAPVAPSTSRAQTTHRPHESFRRHFAFRNFVLNPRSFHIRVISPDRHPPRPWTGLYNNKAKWPFWSLPFQFVAKGCVSKNEHVSFSSFYGALPYVVVITETKICVPGSDEPMSSRRVSGW